MTTKLSIEEAGKASPISNKRWKSYVTASAAVVAGTAGAHGVIVNGVTSPQDMIDANPDDSIPTVFSFQLLTNTDLIFQITESSSSGVFVTAPTGLSFAGFVSGAYFYPSNVPYGAVIGGLEFGVTAGRRGDLAYNGGYSNSQFLDTGGYVAFKFSTVETGDYHGWAELSLIEGVPVNTYRLERYAYANASDSLTVGQVPEPSSMASLALGAVGLLSWRRSRRTN